MHKSIVGEIYTKENKAVDRICAQFTKFPIHCTEVVEKPLST